MEYLFNKNEFNRTVRRKRYKKVYRTLYTSMEVCQNAHLLFFKHKAPTFTSWGFVIT